MLDVSSRNISAPGSVRSRACPLGADLKIALRRLPATFAGLQDQIDRARADTAPPPSSPLLRPRPLDPEEMARTHYAQSVAFDTEARNSDPRFIGIQFATVNAAQ
jgi:hypothetical protein